jgi:hypothetical protein
VKVLALILLNQFSVPFYRNEKLYLYLFQPLGAGILGFTAITIILFFGNLISTLMGTKNPALNIFDPALAGFGFLLKFGENLLKNFQ